MLDKKNKMSDFDENKLFDYQEKIIELMKSYGIEDWKCDELNRASYVLGWNLYCYGFDNVRDASKTPLECISLIKLLNENDNSEILLKHSVFANAYATISSCELKKLIKMLLQTWLYDKYYTDFAIEVECEKKQKLDDFYGVYYNFRKSYTNDELNQIQCYFERIKKEEDKYRPEGKEFRLGGIADWILNIMLENEKYLKFGPTKRYCFIYDILTICEVIADDGVSEKKSKYSKVKSWLKQLEKDRNK